MKIKITCTNGKKGGDNAGFSMALEGGKKEILDTLDIARKSVEALPE